MNTSQIIFEETLWPEPTETASDSQAKFLPYAEFLKMTFDGPQEEYATYLKTDRWHTLRQQRLDIDKGHCRLCFKEATCVHHAIYPQAPRRLGEENLDHLTSLCMTCHNNFHNPPALDEIKKQTYAFAAASGGTKCPICERHFQIYKRSFHAAMAVGIIQMHRYQMENPNEVWIHTERMFKQSSVNCAVRGDTAKLRFFKPVTKPEVFIEPLTVKKNALRNDGSRRNGFYRLTASGIAFAKGEVLIPSFVKLRNNEVIEESKTYIDIHQALRGKFNYRDLMAGR